MKKQILIRSALTLLILGLLTISISPTFARIGVGVGTGKIVVTEKLKPGQIYKFPPVTVLNTGDEEAIYKVSITYHEAQAEYMPPLDWFKFDPNDFNLKPSEAKSVDIRVNIPLKAVPGDYFAYIEASPLKKSENGNTSVGVAAASKLYFTITPANFIEGVYYRTLSLWRLYEPWSTRVSIALGAVVAYFLFKKYFNIEINVKKSKPSNGSNDKSNE